MSGKRTPAVVCPGCGSCVWETRLSSLLDDSGSVSAVYRVLAGRRGHVSTKGGGPSADWVASYSRVQDAPERIQATLRALGRRVLRNLLDLGWVDPDEVRRDLGYEVAVNSGVQAELARRGMEDARLRSMTYAAPLPVTLSSVTRLDPKPFDVSSYGRGRK
jgi:hypothetical protein